MIRTNTNTGAFVARFNHESPNEQHRGKSTFELEQEFGEGNALQLSKVEVNVHEGDQFCRRTGRRIAFRHAMRTLRHNKVLGRPERKAIGDAIRQKVKL